MSLWTTWNPLPLPITAFYFAAVFTFFFTCLGRLLSFFSFLRRRAGSLPFFTSFENACIICFLCLLSFLITCVGSFLIKCFGRFLMTFGSFLLTTWRFPLRFPLLFPLLFPLHFPLW